MTTHLEPLARASPAAASASAVARSRSLPGGSSGRIALGRAISRRGSVTRGDSFTRRAGGLSSGVDTRDIIVAGLANGANARIVGFVGDL